MSQVWIKYSNDNWGTETKASFSAILDREIPTVVKERGQTKRGIDYAHVLFNKTKRKIVISADELWEDAQKTEIRNIWNAGALKYSDDDSTYIDVVLDADGDYSPDFLEDDESLEEVELILIYREPN